MNLDAREEALVAVAREAGEEHAVSEMSAMREAL